MKTHRLLLAAALGALACSPEKPAPPPPAPLLSGGFHEITPAQLPGQLPAADPTQPETWTVGLFGDLDGDGQHELVLTTDGMTLAYPWDPATGAWGEGKDPLQQSHAHVQAVQDMDDDGHPDLWVADGSIEWGMSSGPHPSDSMVKDAHWSRGMGVSWADVDQDGWLDFVGAGLCCGSEVCSDMAIGLRTDARSFRLVGTDSGLLPGPRLKSYLAGLAPIGKGTALVHFGEACPDAPADQPAFFVQKGLDDAGFPQYQLLDPLPADALFRGGDPKRTLVSVAPMGAAVGDLDNDGRLDLVVATNPFLEIFQQQEDGKYVSRGATSGIARRPGEKHFQLPWGVAIVDVNLDGKNDLVVAYGNDGEAHTNPDAYIGPQNVSVYVNQGDFRFADATAEIGARTGQWKSLVVDDFDCDGDADLVVGGNDEWPQVLRNDVGDHHHALSLRLHGNLSNSVGMGARVEAWPEGGGPVRHAFVGGILSPQAFSPPAAYIGLGSATSAEKVRITWPSGLVQEVPRLPGGRCITIEEPKTVWFSPGSRHAKVGEGIRVKVTPRDELGAPANAEVQLRVLSGPAQAVLTKQPDGLDAVITSNEAGSSTIEIRIGETTLDVRPRLWWEP